MSHAPWRTLGALVAALALLLSGVAYAQGASATGATEGSSLLPPDDGGFEAKPLKVVLLGDSYSAGNGARNDNGDHDFYGPKDCYRSRSNWSEKYVSGLRAIGYNITYLNRACSGGVTDDVLSPRKMDTNEYMTFLDGYLSDESDVKAGLEAQDPCGAYSDYPDEESYSYEVIGFSPNYGSSGSDPNTQVAYSCTRYLAAQLDAINADTDLVLFTMGGNDINFSDIVKQCFVTGLRSPGGCRDKVEDAPATAAVVRSAARDLRPRCGTTACAGRQDRLPRLPAAWPWTTGTTSPSWLRARADHYEVADEVREPGASVTRPARDRRRGQHRPRRPDPLPGHGRAPSTATSPTVAATDRNPVPLALRVRDQDHARVLPPQPGRAHRRTRRCSATRGTYGAGGALGGGSRGDIDIVLAIDTTGSMGSTTSTR